MTKNRLIVILFLTILFPLLGNSQRIMELSKIFLNDGSLIYGEVLHTYSSGKYYIQLLNNQAFYIDQKDVGVIEPMNKAFLVDDQGKSILIRGSYFQFSTDFFFSSRIINKLGPNVSTHYTGTGVTLSKLFSINEKISLGLGVGYARYPVIMEAEYIDASSFFHYRNFKYQTIPVFAKLRGFLFTPQKMINLYYSIEVGKVIPFKDHVRFSGDQLILNKKRTRLNEYFIQPKIGFLLPSSALTNPTLELGYQLMRLKAEEEVAQSITQRTLWEYGFILSFGFAF